MLLTLTLTQPAVSDAAQADPLQPASDLGFLLHKHPERVQTQTLSFGTASVFYPQVSAQCTTAALLLEVDPVALSRTARPGEGAPLEPYVNDRPYASGSFLAVALRDAFGTAFTGRSKDRQALADRALAFSVHLPCVTARGPEGLPERLFGPLGYAVQATPIPLDPLYPEWGERPYVELRLSGQIRLRDLLAHLYVLLPVLDGKRHYFLNEAEVDKLARHGTGWLDSHPERDLITRRYLRFAALVRQAEEGYSESHTAESGETTAALPRPRLHDERLQWVAEQVATSGASTVLDLGCGEGKLLRLLLERAQFRQLLGMDVSARALEIAARRLNLRERPELAARVTLLHGSLSYPDSRLKGFDAATLVEVIEHLEPHQIGPLTRHVFGDAHPGTVIVTTPNREYNAVFEDADKGMRHADHRFEWTRAEFGAWAGAAAEAHGYTLTLHGLSDTHPDYGPITQAAIFVRQKG
ncbi:3' terminal RNA ribose 2'-O-methyltransferase Hen1 [Deinococcus sp. QL22]|uniref:3' terminal RNA ribose 2'-O-methyltransferase Hen1 n=1 Tax=Deinococcus sp. QL22 TaxID=2939437 RepID=UPI0020183E70|nr:3' terminal RNA ribose 2'-O-methyltransferase Hen1 [Deinococcus sp. QL22]UQN07426.1 3' terminal RNA ribose 2'-O-methyltransferase Hen1 [Deinococcus sp. QL22]